MAACRRILCLQIIKARPVIVFLLFCFVIINFYLFYNKWGNNSPKQDVKVFRSKEKLQLNVNKELAVQSQRDVTVENETSHFWENIDVVIPFSDAIGNVNLQKKFRVCVESILKHSSVFITFHIIGDNDSWRVSKKIFQEISLQKGVMGGNSKLGVLQHRTVYKDISLLGERVGPVLSVMRRKFSYKSGAYYSHILFFLSVAVHRIFSENLEKLIMLDADLKFKADIRDLFNLFKNFNDSNIIGIAPEMQPVYRHTFQMYRDKHPGTLVGEPLPGGKPGFNSGVLLLDLKKMRESQKYNALVTAGSVETLANKFMFKGHLGDQDFFTLISMDYGELFYSLPCVWNYQLCTWWRDKGYKSVFQLYNNCTGKVKIHHGNCGTPIPNN